MSVDDDDYSRNASCALKLISTFVLCTWICIQRFFVLTLWAEQRKTKHYLPPNFPLWKNLTTLTTEWNLIFIKKIITIQKHFLFRICECIGSIYIINLPTYTAPPANITTPSCQHIRFHLPTYTAQYCQHIRNHPVNIRPHLQK